MLEKKLGYTFKNKKLLENALTHKSFLVKDRGCPNNERLEFFGDAILDFVVTEYLMKKFQNQTS